MTTALPKKYREKVGSMINTAALSNEQKATEGRAQQPKHVLVSAYACDPNKGSEPGVGWNWIQHLSTHCRVSVITRTNNRRSINAWLQNNALPNVRFYYVDVPRALSLWKRGQRGVYLYYIIWQRMALRLARRILAADPFELAHHVTFASLHMPIFLQQLPVPLVYGPVGGGEMGAPAFWRGGGWRAMLYEGLRATRMKSLRGDLFVQATLRKARRILVATPETAVFVPRQLQAKTDVMLAIGIETPDPCEGSGQQQGNGEQNRACRIYAAGRLLHWKGFSLAIQAFARVAKTYPDATFTIVGDGPQRAQLAQLVLQEGVADQVKIERWLPRPEVLRLAASSDIFLYPSLHDSGGMVVLEAMAAAKPVICLDIGGPGVMVTEDCGVRIPVVTPDQVVAQLAQALERLMADPALRQQMGMAAKQRVVDEFTWEKKATRMFELYGEVVASR